MVQQDLEGVAMNASDDVDSILGKSGWIEYKLEYVARDENKQREVNVIHGGKTLAPDSIT